MLQVIFQKIEFGFIHRSKKDGVITVTANKIPSALEGEILLGDIHIVSWRAEPKEAVLKDEDKDWYWSIKILSHKFDQSYFNISQDMFRTTLGDIVVAKLNQELFKPPIIRSKKLS